eukprot:TRINITY_DN127554_c0_g1_i1.p1 TRINITY_DN127554_c0_g1~~TRINITY_DN127554_c0_g1_i1.p1  ORF type:complete len:145 (-),score=27.70 TRINITY_DN127554_c0_g1_i1:57-491(-)
MSAAWCEKDELAKLTPSRAAVYELLSRLPEGSITTYGDIAKVIGSSAQAVGNACSKNPFYPVVPCYRVVGAGGRLSGLFSETDLSSPLVQKKVALLKKEGVAVRDGQLLDFSSKRYEFSAQDRERAVALKDELETRPKKRQRTE